MDDEGVESVREGLKKKEIENKTNRKKGRPIEKERSRCEEDKKNRKATEEGRKRGRKEGRKREDKGRTERREDVEIEKWVAGKE